MNKLILYVLDGCPYCNRALDIVEQRGLSYKKIVVSQDRKNYYKKLHGMNTFPQIFMANNGTTWKIGGYDDLVSYLS